MSMNHHTPSPAPTPLCAIFEPRVALLSSGMLEADETAAVHEHLAGCAYCQLQLGEYQRLREDVLRLLLGGENAPAHVQALATGVAEGEGRVGMATEASVHFTLDDIVRASEEKPSTSPQPRRVSYPSEAPRRRVLTSLGAIAAVILLALLAASLFGALRLPYTPASQPTATPQIQGPFVPYTASAPGLPCDTNPQASALWSGDQGTCLDNPPRTKLASQGHLLAVMRWDAASYHLPESYKVSVQATLVGSGTAKLQIDNSGRGVTHVIACSPGQCEIDGKPARGCACDTSAPLTLAITIQGRNESFAIDNVQLATATEPEDLQPDSIALGVSTSDPSAQGAQATFANFAVVAV